MLFNKNSEMDRQLYSKVSSISLQYLKFISHK